METSTNPNRDQGRRTESDGVHEAYEQVRGVLNAELTEGLLSTRRLYEAESSQSYATAYNKARKLLTEGNRARQRSAGLSFNGDATHDVAAMRRYAKKQSEVRAALAVDADLQQLIIDQLGYEPDTDQFEEVRAPLFTLVTSPEEVWYGDDSQGSEGLVGQLNNLDAQPSDETSAEHQGERELDRLARAKHEAFAAKLRAPIFGQKRKDAMATYEAAEQAYLSGVATEEAELVAQMRQAGASAEEINDALVERINDRATADEEAQKHALLEQGGKWAKTLNWYAARSKKGKIALNIVAGAGLALAGSAAAVVAGVAGMGAGMVGAGMLAGRYGRAYAVRLSKLYDRTDDQPGFDLDEGTADDHESVARSIDFLKTTSRDHIKNAEKLKKGAVVGAMGAVALGGSIVIARDIINDAPDIRIGFGVVGEKFSDWFGNDIETPRILPDLDGDGIPDISDSDRDGDGVLNNIDPAPDNPNITGLEDTIVDRGEMFDGYQGTREFTALGQADFNNWINSHGGYDVKPGDTVWSISEQYLQQNGVNNPTTFEIDAVKDSVLKELQARGMADSRGWLNVGDTIKIK